MVLKTIGLQWLGPELVGGDSATAIWAAELRVKGGAGPREAQQSFWEQSGGATERRVERQVVACAAPVAGAEEDDALRWWTGGSTGV